jgi:hypothetical protein
MPGPGRDVQIRLYRDALSTPWGFRLHGGKDLKTPLTVQKVAAGSPVFGELQRDDVILEIQNCDATQMTHKQAQDMIRNAGGSLLVRIRRSGHHETTTTAGSGLAYNGSGAAQRGFMLGRVKDTLTGVLLSDHTPSSGYVSNNNYSDYSDVYSPTLSYASGDSGAYVNKPVKTWNLPKPAYKPQPANAAGLFEPGWTPEVLRQPRGRRPQTSSAAAPHIVPVHRSQHQQYPAVDPAYQPPQQRQNEPPAWYGSLRPSVGARQSDERVAGVAPHHRSMSPDYGRRATASSWSAPPAGNNVIVAPEGVQNLQYNTPMGLYSRSNVEEALTGQMGGLGLNEGVRTESDVYRLVHDADRHRGGGAGRRRGPPTTGSEHLLASHDADIRQSPSIRILETRFGDGAGTSDF